MAQALELARRGAGRTSPNPLVGAVLVSDGKVVGTGYHMCYGGPHAEINALEEAGDRARGATLYVTLEPCCVSGQTPPCTDALIRAGVARVVLPVLDPNPCVCGRGVESLRGAGIEVVSGVLVEEASRLNAAYLKYRREGLPFVLLKMAVSLDGRAAPPPAGPRWTSSETSRELVHRMRSEVDAVMVGVGTVLSDDPSLTDRREDGSRQPARVVLDTGLRTPPGASVLRPDGGRTLVVCAGDADGARRVDLEEAGARVLSVPRGAEGSVDLLEAMGAVAREGLLSVLAEGGPRLATSLLNAGLVDRVAFFIAPRIYGSGGTEALAELRPEWSSGRWRLESASWREAGRDLLFEADVAYADAAETSDEERHCVHGTR
jgi:diaminohydroxyphosphoribosylaminopyrimidine deaminase/5-amino-6-(5-phosphoribosylamino)uracil reductase